MRPVAENIPDALRRFKEEQEGHCGWGGSDQERDGGR